MKSKIFRQLLTAALMLSASQNAAMAEARYSVVPIGPMDLAHGSSAYLGQHANGKYMSGTVRHSSEGNETCSLFRWTPDTGVQLKSLPDSTSCYYGNVRNNGIGDVLHRNSGVELASVWRHQGDVVPVGGASSIAGIDQYPTSINNFGVVSVNLDFFQFGLRAFGFSLLEEPGRVFLIQNAIYDNLDHIQSASLGELNDAGEVGARVKHSDGSLAIGILEGSSYHYPSGVERLASLPNEDLSECYPRELSQDGKLLIQCYEAWNNSRIYRFNSESNQTELMFSDVASANMNSRGDFVVRETNGRVLVKTAQGQLRDLNEADETTGFDILETIGVTDDGSVLAFATRRIDYKTFVVAIRERTCAGAADLNFDGLVNSRDLTLFLARFGQDDVGRATSADFNADGRVDTQDMIKFLSKFGRPQNC